MCSADRRLCGLRFILRSLDGDKEAPEPRIGARIRHREWKYPKTLGPLQRRSALRAVTLHQSLQVRHLFFGDACNDDSGAGRRASGWQRAAGTNSTQTILANPQRVGWRQHFLAQTAVSALEPVVVDTHV